LRVSSAKRDTAPREPPFIAVERGAFLVVEFSGTTNFCRLGDRDLNYFFMIFSVQEFMHYFTDKCERKQIPED
jgi:hypothetical protein